MLYKGLGCQQNYNAAFELFKKGAEAGKSRSMHFLGLCYLNGYGVEENETLAKKWLEKSASQGNEEAKKALALDGPEGISSVYLKTIVKDNDIPSDYTPINHNATPSQLAGLYKGYMVTYDWSGNKIVQLLLLSLDLKVDGEKITGQWLEGNGIAATISAQLNDQEIIFNSAPYKRKDNYNNEGLWLLKNASIELLEQDKAVSLKGNLNMFSPETLEPGKPMYITLSRVSQAPAEKISMRTEMKMAVYPNPCLHKTTVNFTILSDANVEISVSSILEKEVIKKGLGKLSAGVHSVELPVNLLSTGSYVLRVRSGNEVKTTILLKQ